jgi:hypothetical protein
MKNVCIKTALAAMLLATLAPAQGPGGRPGPPRGGAEGDDNHWIGREMSPPGKIVRGAPYSAQAVSEVNQTLGDGTKIHRQVTGGVYRDGQGRTRNEVAPGGHGLFAPAGHAEQLITISDPVAGFTYVLDPAQKTATKVPLHRGGPMGGAMMGPAPHGGGPMGGAMMGPAPGGGAERRPMHAGPGAAQEDFKSEFLPATQIEGVSAEGRRITTTILAGQIGNDRPITSVSERWFSPKLQVVVLMTHNDPRMGQDTYKLTKIALAEPDPALFEVPAGYTVVEGKRASFPEQHHQGGPPNAPEHGPEPPK